MLSSRLKALVMPTTQTRVTATLSRRNAGSRCARSADDEREARASAWPASFQPGPKRGRARRRADPTTNTTAPPSTTARSFPRRGRLRRAWPARRRGTCSCDTAAAPRSGRAEVAGEDDDREGRPDGDAADARRRGPWILRGPGSSRMPKRRASDPGHRHEGSRERERDGEDERRDERRAHEGSGRLPGSRRAQLAVERVHVADETVRRVAREHVCPTGQRATARGLGLPGALRPRPGECIARRAAGTRRPRSSSPSRSGVPPTRVATTGRAAASASISATGVPSLREALTTRSRSP